VNELRATMVRVATDFGSDPIRAKIANAEQVKSIPCWWSPVAIPICGAGNVSVRLHGKGNIGAKPKGKAVKDILAAIEKRWS